MALVVRNEGLLCPLGRNMNNLETVTVTHANILNSLML